MPIMSKAEAMMCRSAPWWLRDGLAAVAGFESITVATRGALVMRFRATKPMT